MAYTVKITQLGSGETRDYTLKTDGDYSPENDLWWWTEGNAGCDCNRALFFGVDGSDVQCSEGRYSVTLPDGTVV